MHNYPKTTDHINHSRKHIVTFTLPGVIFAPKDRATASEASSSDAERMTK